MLDRKQYDIEMDRVHQEEIKEITKYLTKYIEMNADMRNQKLNTLNNPKSMDYVKNTPIPTKGRDFKVVADELVENIFNNQSLLQHPRYLSLVCTSISPYALLGSILADIYNVNVAGGGFAPAANAVEEKLIAYMAGRVGYDTTKATGVFTSGGSLSNLTGMIAARENKLNHNADLSRAVAYTSDQAHSSVVKGMKMMGLRPDQIRVIPSDEKFKIKLDVLQNMIADDVRNGLRPFLIVGTCGTTNTGSIDPLEELSKIAKQYDMWLHVDGAYGGSILFSDIYNNLAKGVELSDSFTWDTHKWSLQPYASSTVLCRDRNQWIDAFNEHPEYLEDVRGMENLDGWDRGIEMSRPFRAAKLWTTLQSLGTDKLADVIDYSFYNCSVMQDELAKHDYWEVIAPPMCAALNFRLAPKNVDPSKYNEITHKLSEKLNDTGYAYILTTTLRGKVCCRVCLINGNTTTEDIINTVEKLDAIAQELIEEYKK